MLINTINVERTVEKHQLLRHMSEEVRCALTRLFYEHVNPYGLFAIDIDQPSFPEAA